MGEYRSHEYVVYRQCQDYGSRKKYNTMVGNEQGDCRDSKYRCLQRYLRRVYIVGMFRYDTGSEWVLMNAW